MAKTLNKKAKKVLNKLLRKEICPHCNHRYHCNHSLLDHGIGWAEEGTEFMEVSLNGDTLDYEEDEFQRNGDGYFYCRNCGEELDFSEDEIIEILELEKI